MAPEVIKQSGHGRHADIWSLGCTVIEMATGMPPWSEITDQVSVLFHIANSDELPPLPRGLSEEGTSFLLQCLKKCTEIYPLYSQLRNPHERPTAARLLTHSFVCDAVAPRRF